MNRRCRQAVWERGYVFLDKELHKISRRAREKRRYADKLVKIWQRDGQETWVLVHVEIQAGYEKDFADPILLPWRRRHICWRRRPGKIRNNGLRASWR